MDDRSRRSALRVALVYLAAGGLWILLSDWLVARFAADLGQLVAFQVGKGLAFVLLSGALIYGLVRRERDRWEAAQRDLRDSKRLLDAVVEGTSDAVYVKDREGRYLLINQAGAEVVGETPGAMIGRRDEEFFGAEEGRRIRRDDRRVMETGEPLEKTEEADVPGRGRRLFDTIKAPLREGDAVVGVVGISRDFTERESARRALEQVEQKYRTLFEAAPMGITLSTLEGGRLVEVNRGFVQLLGYDRDELLGRRASELGLWVDPSRRELLVERVSSGEGASTVDARLRRRDDEVIEARVTGEALTVDGERTLMAVVRDVTEERRFERELERMALHDGLTGLANRSLFHDRLERALSAAERHGEPVAVLFLDLDRFKVVNDTLGHPAGDRLLERVADRLASGFREEDTVARLGGDEFGVLLERFESPDAVERAAKRLVGLFEAPFEVDGQEVHVSVSVGVALADETGATPEDMLRFSDIAMYRAKERQGSAYHRYDADVDAREGDRLHRENSLRRAIDEGELELHYQPVVRLATGRIVGAEALVRWRDPERGLVPPGAFLPLAEETGLVIPLGDWVVRTAVRQARTWRRPGGSREPIGIGFNLSPAQLHEPDVVDRLRTLLSESDFDPARVVVEITESAVLRTHELTRELRALGIQVALDDLGTGYASLEYLAHLDVDLMKVDRLFVSGLGTSEPDEAIVEAAAQIARRLGTPVVAEGVETEAQLARLRELDYDYAQGFLFSEPLPAEAFERLLAEDPRWEAAS